jgi:Glycosyltransferase family 87
MMARRRFAVPVVILGSLFAGALYAWFSGEDINWDWQNYHEYGAFALLNGRFETDVAPAGLQTFLNPLAYVPAYLLRHHVGAPWWGMLLGAIHGLNLALIYWLSRTVLGRGAGIWAVLSSLVIAAFGPMTLSEVGTSFADILTALPVIAGVTLILSAGEAKENRKQNYLLQNHFMQNHFLQNHFLMAGLLIGASVGLKLTNSTFLIGAGVSLLFAARPLAAMVSFAAGSVVGGLVTGGAWAWMLWQQFGNPLFPFYNNIFRSAEAPSESIADGRFLPHGLWDAALYPFDWLIGDHRSSEWAFRDPRFAVVVILLALVAATGLLRKVEVLRIRDKQFLLFFAVTYTIWLLMFAIHRYAIALELMTAPLIVLLLSRLVQALDRNRATPRPSSVGAVATLIVAVAIAIWSQPADWLRRPWSDPYRPQLAGSLLIPATYLMLEKGTGYVAPLLPETSRLYQLSDIIMPIVPGGSLDHRIRWGLAHPLAGGVWALHLRGRLPLRDGPPRVELLDAYGLMLDESRACERFAAADGLDVEVCHLVPKSQASLEPS